MKKILFLTLVLISALNSGCYENIEANDPLSVATLFWDAALGENPEDAKQYMQNSFGVSIGIKGKSGQDAAVFGEANQQEGYYFIETTLELPRNGKVVSIPLRTVVVPVDGRWKVDYWSTKQSLFDATFDSSIKWFVMTLGDAGLYFDNMSDIQDQKDALVSADARLTEQFRDAKSMLLENYKIQMERARQQAEEMKAAAAAVIAAAAKAEREKPVLVQPAD